MHQAKVGDRVRVEYVRLRSETNGNGKAKVKGPSPKTVEFTVGSQDVMPGLSLGVTGMAPGEHKRFTLQPIDAYGPAKPGLVKEIPRQQFPARIVLRVGKRLARSTFSGRRRKVRVVQIKPESVVVDGNHPLAGKVVELAVTLISVDSSADANRSRPSIDNGGKS